MDAAGKTLEVAPQHSLAFSHGDRRRIFGETFCRTPSLGPSSSRANKWLRAKPLEVFDQVYTDAGEVGAGRYPVFFCQLKPAL